MQGWLNLPKGMQLEAPQGNFAPSSPTISPADMGKILFKRKWIILMAAVAGVAIGLFHAETAIPEYQATARVNIDVGRTTNIGIESVIQQSGAYVDPDELLQTQVQIMRSQTVALDAINMLDLYHKKPFSDVFKDHPYDGKLTPQERADLIANFQGATAISVLPNTDLVDVSFENPDPALAKNAANAIVDAYMQRDLRARFEGTTRISDWLAQQLTGLKQQVDSNQKNLSDYVQKNNLLPTDGQGGNLVMDSLTTVNQQLAEAKADRIVKEARYKMALTRNPELLISVAPGTILGSLRQQQAQLMVQAAQLKAKFGPDYPKIIELNKQLASVQSDIDAEITNLTKRFADEYNTALQTEGLLQSRLDALKKAAYQENASAAQYDVLKHNAESAAALYSALNLKLQEAGVTAGLNSNSVDVVDRATIPATPVSPKKRSDVAFGLLGGVLVGLILAFFLETMDDTLRTSEEAESISEMPSLAVVPRFAARKDGVPALAPGGRKLLPDMVSSTEPHSLGAEAFRTLRSAILLSAVDRDPKVLLVTSSFAEEGKSTVAANLAISFAQRQERVLLVDTDLRRGTTHLKFGLSNRVGLSSVLAREAGREAYEQPLTDLPGLKVLSRGPIPPNPGEMLASQSMEEMLKQWRNEYDRIILDSSPVLAVSDSLSLAPQADNIMILVRSGVTRKKALLRTRDLLQRTGARVSGLVINDADLRLEHYYTYSRGYSYSYKANYGAGYGATDEKK